MLVARTFWYQNYEEDRHCLSVRCVKIDPGLRAHEKYDWRTYAWNASVRDGYAVPERGRPTLFAALQRSEHRRPADSVAAFKYCGCFFEGAHSIGYVEPYYDIVAGKKAADNILVSRHLRGCVGCMWCSRAARAESGKLTKVHRLLLTLIRGKLRAQMHEERRGTELRDR